MELLPVPQQSYNGLLENIFIRWTEVSHIWSSLTACSDEYIGRSPQFDQSVPLVDCFHGIWSGSTLYRICYEKGTDLNGYPLFVWCSLLGEYVPR